MDGQNYLGIYLSKNEATVVCINSQGRDRKVLACFSVSLEQSEQQSIASLIAQGCAERNLTFSEVAVALDCKMFMQHKVHSEFTDPKQIAATVRFDTEEAISSDISDVAIAFKILSSDETGSALAVFTSQRKALSEILLSLQANNIDPIAIEPDINCLSRFLLQNVSSPENSHPLFATLSNSNGYFIAFDKSQQSQIERTFLIGPTQNRSDLLAREVPITIVLASADKPIDCIKVFDSAESIDYSQLNERLGIEVDAIDLAASASAETLADCTSVVDFAIAYGAALTHEKPQSVNLRDDFMPYQGKKMRMQKAMKILGVAMLALCVAAGLYFQLQLMQQNKNRSRLRKKFQKQYSSVMLGQKLPRKTNPINKLKSEKKRIENAKSGQLSVTGEETISAKLTSVFESFNKVAKQTNLNIDSVSITTKAINIVGDTSSRKNTLKLFGVIKGSGNSQKHLQPKGGRDSFSITIVPEKK